MTFSFFNQSSSLWYWPLKKDERWRMHTNCIIALDAKRLHGTLESQSTFLSWWYLNLPCGICQHDTPIDHQLIFDPIYYEELYCNCRLDRCFQNDSSTSASTMLQLLSDKGWKMMVAFIYRKQAALSISIQVIWYVNMSLYVYLDCQPLQVGSRSFILCKYSNGGNNKHSHKYHLVEWIHTEAIPEFFLSRKTI